MPTVKMLEVTTERGTFDAKVLDWDVLDNGALSLVTPDGLHSVYAKGHWQFAQELPWNE